MNSATKNKIVNTSEREDVESFGDAFRRSLLSVSLLLLLFLLLILLTVSSDKMNNILAACAHLLDRILDLVELFLGSADQIAEHLGRDPTVGAQYSALLRERVVAYAESLAQAKIGDLDGDATARVRKRDEHVLRLDVTVNDAQRVQVIETARGLLEHVENAWFYCRWLFEVKRIVHVLGQRHLTEFESDVAELKVRFGAVVAQHVRVLVRVA